MRPGFFLYRRRMTRRTFFRSVLILLLTALLLISIFASVQMRPLLSQLATTRAANTVNRIVFEAVDEAIAAGEISYDRLISFEKDADGRITAVYSNMAAFNRLQVEILDIILARIEQVSARELSIPIGSLSGSSLLSGRGPRIRVRMESVGSSSAQFRNLFETAGINQTRHQIVLEIYVSVSILLPGFSTATKISNSITVAETVIVGSVPQTYTHFQTSPQQYEEDAKDHILNGD